MDLAGTREYSGAIVCNVRLPPRVVLIEFASATRFMRER